MQSTFAPAFPTSPPIPTAQVFTMPLSAEVQLVPLQFGVEIPNRVFVGGCPYNMTEKELGDFFCQFGPIKDSKIVFDKATGKSLGYGFVTYICETDAINVYSRGSVFYNEKKLNVSKAVRKQGGQFMRPNQEFLNGMYVNQPNSYFVDQTGLWVNPMTVTQQVKPNFYTAVLMGPGMQQVQQQAVQVSYGVHNPTVGPIAPPPYVQQPASYPSFTTLTPSHITQPPTVQEITAHNRQFNQENVIQVSQLEATVSIEQNISFESDKDHQEGGTCVTDSAYSSDHSSQETASGVDLDRLFDRRTSPLANRRRNGSRRRTNSFQSPTQPDHNFAPAHQPGVGLLPHPVGYPSIGGYASVPM